jgi:site-specific DNA-methyltransferase (adenine-specific)
VEISDLKKSYDFLTDPRLNMQLNVEAQKMYQAIKKDKFEELKKRITKRGQIKPLIVTPDGEVLGGNMRLRAMQELGIKEAWVSVVEPTSEADKIEIALTDNEEMGYYEDQALAELVAQYKDEIDLSKYSVHLGQSQTLEEILKQFSPDEVVEDEAPEVADEAVSELRKVYQLGRHRLMCGDSTKIEDVERLMDGKKADMVFTDPPYGVDYEGGLSNSKKREKLIGDTGDITELFERSLTNAVSSTIDKSAYYIFFSFDNKNVSRVLESVKNAGLKIKALLIWHKINAGFGSLNHRYKQKHEPFLYCCKDKFSENFYLAIYLYIKHFYYICYASRL